MKKIIAVVVCFVLMLSIFPSTALANEHTPFVLENSIPAYDGFCGDDVMWTLNGTELTISGKGDMYPSYWISEDLPWGYDITSVIVKNGVTSIGDESFRECTRLESIIIPDSVTSIGNRAFYNCTSLTSIDLGKELLSIGWEAFAMCTALVSISLPDSVISVESGVFYNTGYYNNEENWENGVLYIGKCLIEAKNQTGHFSIKEDVRVIGENSFLACSLTSVSIPNSVTTIGSFAFSSCSDLSAIAIPDSVQYIGGYAFSCENLESILLPDCAISFGNDPFTNSAYYKNEQNWENDILYIGKHLIEAKKLSGHYDIKEGTLSIGGGAFSSCAELTSVTIPDSVGIIGHNAFYGVENLASVTIGDGVKIIEDTAFGWCPNLETIIIGKNVKSIGYLAFNGCENLKKVYITDLDAWCNIDFDSGHANPLQYSADLYLNNTLFKNLVIPEDSSSISEETFFNCGSITSLTIPKNANLDTIGCWELGHLTDIYFGGNIYQWYNYDGSRQPYAENLHFAEKEYSFNVTDSILCEMNETTGQMILSGTGTIPEGMLGHPWEAMFGYLRKFVKNIIINDGITSIEDYAFYNSKYLIKVEIPKTVTSIGYAAFDGCTGIKYVYYTGSLTQYRNLEIELDNEPFENADTYCNGEHLHYYENDCSTTCHCGYVRTVTHYRQTAYDATTHFDMCILCGNTINVSPHKYDNACDTSCNVCGATRSITHTYGNYVYNNDATTTKDGTKTRTCSVCGAKDTVTAVGTKIKNPFTDVKAGEYFTEPVLWAVGKEITKGTSATTFAPNDQCTRGQIVTFLWRAAGSPEPRSTRNPFTDVKSDQYYYKAVLWAVEKGITNGTSATTFSPNATCTRGQVVTFLWRAKGKPSATATTAFTDVKAGQYYTEAVAWAVKNGITTGMSATQFAPDATCTRGQIVTFLYRAYK